VSEDGVGNAGSAAKGGPLEPDWIRELGLSCRQFVWAKLQIELDGTAETLPILDHYISLVREDLRKAPHTTELVTQAIAAYFGTVTALTIDGFWRVSAASDQGWLICARRVFMAINPLGVAHDVLGASVDHDGPSSELRIDGVQRELIAQRLARLPAPREDEYFTLSARLEVIDIAVAALSEQLHLRGVSEISFGPDDYSGL